MMVSMLALVRTAMLDLAASWKQSGILALLVATTTLAYLSVGAYQAGMERLIPGIDAGSLVVQASHTTGEIAGSRLPASVEDQLRRLGLEPVVPEIHAVVGTSAEDAVLLRGVDPARYHLALSFELLSGQALQPGETPRLALLGWRLAERRGLSVGAPVRLRGRDFQVAGIFRTGTYADNEAWISLTEAQVLLGWQDEVSIFIVPNNGRLQPGAELPGGISVIRRGEGLQNDVRRMAPLLSLISDILQLTGWATACALAVSLLRLAWLRRRQSAVLRCLGFSPAALTAYLLAQSTAIAGGGALLGLLGSLVLTNSLRTLLLGLEMRPQHTPEILLSGLVWTAAIAGLGMLFPAVWLGRQNLADLLRRE